MASSVYSEVTSVSTYGFERDRVLDKLKIASKDLPYNVDDITISHNDFAIADVYNDSIRKLYSNYLFLIANAEIGSDNSPLSAAPKYVAIENTTQLAALSTRGELPVGVTHSNSLSNLKETFIVNQTDGTGKLLVFNYSKDNSYAYEINSGTTSVTTLLSGNEVEFNKSFKFKEVVSVDSKDNFLFVLDRGANTVYKFDITGLITSDKALKRTNADDSQRPGRYLLKTIGGEGTGQTKNKLINPNGLSVYKDKLYILDNGHNSIKVFDLDFNFLKEVSAPNLFNNPNYGELVSIVVDQYSDTTDAFKGYILSSNGKVFEYNFDTNTIKVPESLYDYYDTRLQVLSALDLSKSFKKIVNSKIKKNILYLCNSGRIYKYYKTNFKTYIAELDLSLPIGNLTNEQEILSFDTTINDGKEYIAVTVLNYPNGQVSTHFFTDDHNSTKLYNENFYTNYFTLSNILVLPQEVVNNITFNKTTKKIIYNHYSLFENLNKKIYSFYNTTSGLAAYPSLSVIAPHQFTRPSALNENHNLFIGVNEPLLTDVINRPLKLLFNQQEALFDLIKEESLNTNPPEDYTVFLPGDVTEFPNILSLNSTSQTVVAGKEIEIGVTRTNLLSTKPSCSFKYYTTLGNNTLSSEFEYIDVKTPAIDMFGKNETSFTIKLATDVIFSGGARTFDLILKENTNCIIDPDKAKHTVTITPIGEQFTVTFESSAGSLEEGATTTPTGSATGRVKIIRTPNAGIENWWLTGGDTSVNISVTPSNIATTQYTPVVPLSTEYAVVGDKFTDFPQNSPGESFASEVENTSTIHFTQGVSSVVFDLSAVNNKESDNDIRTLLVKLNNISDNASFGSITTSEFLVNDKFETISLHLSSISATNRADGTSNTLLSCVNIWEALSASTKELNTTAFSAVSTDNPVLVNFTINAPLSIFSVSAVSGALRFEPDEALNFNNNKLNVIVDSNAGLFGAGGAGGHGARAMSGNDFTQDGTGSDDLSAFTFEGEDGGFVIGSVNLSTYFNVITISNSGKVYGGAGGGGGGILGVSAASMPMNTSVTPNVLFLSAGCGGGGGSCIHLSGCGPGGLAAMSEVEDDDGNITFSQDANFDDIHLANGNIGNVNGSGGLGGAFTNSPGNVSLGAGAGNVALTSFPAMSGADGGNLGDPGDGDTVPVPIYNDTVSFAGSFATVSAFFGVREGGDAGSIVDGTFTSVTSSGTGETRGSNLLGI